MLKTRFLAKWSDIIKRKQPVGRCTAHNNLYISVLAFWWALPTLRLFMFDYLKGNEFMIGFNQ